MSRLPCQTRGMKNKQLCRINKTNKAWPVPDEVVARFGTVRLVRKADGGHDLVGGTRHDQASAKKWCSRFAPFVGFVKDFEGLSRREANWLSGPAWLCKNLADDVILLRP